MYSLIATAWPDPLRIRINELQPRCRYWSEKSCTGVLGKGNEIGKTGDCDWLGVVTSGAIETGLRSKALDWFGFCKTRVSWPI